MLELVLGKRSNLDGELAFIELVAAGSASAAGRTDARRTRTEDALPGHLANDPRLTLVLVTGRVVNPKLV